MTYKNIILCAFFLSAIIACNNKKITTPLTHNTIHNLLKTQQLNWNAGSTDSFMLGYWNHDSMLFISSKGPRYGWKNTRDAYKKNYPTKNETGVLTFDKIHIKYLDDEKQFANVLGTWQVEQLHKDTVRKLNGHFSIIIQQINNEPKIIIDHTW